MYQGPLNVELLEEKNKHFKDKDFPDSSSVTQENHKPINQNL